MAYPSYCHRTYRLNNMSIQAKYTGCTQKSHITSVLPTVPSPLPTIPVDITRGWINLHTSVEYFLKKKRHLMPSRALRLHRFHDVCNLRSKRFYSPACPHGHRGFVMENVTMEQIIVWILQFPPAIFDAAMLHTQNATSVTNAVRFTNWQRR